MKKDILANIGVAVISAASVLVLRRVVREAIERRREELAEVELIEE